MTTKSSDSDNGERAYNPLLYILGANEQLVSFIFSSFHPSLFKTFMPFVTIIRLGSFAGFAWSLREDKISTLT